MQNVLHDIQVTYGPHLVLFQVLTGHESST